METIGDRIKSHRKAAGLTQGALAKIIGIKASSVTQWELGITQPNGNNLLRLARALDADPVIFTDDYNNSSSFSVNYGITEPEPPTYQPTVRVVPLISDVSAGAWRDIIDNFHPGDAEHWQETTAKVSKAAFALKVEGKSMQNPTGSPSIPHGSTVIVDPNIAANSGSIVVAKLPDSNRATVKRLIIDGSDIFLEALNPDYKPIKIDQDCVIVGVVKQVIQDI